MKRPAHIAKICMGCCLTLILAGCRQDEDMTVLKSRLDSLRQQFKANIEPLPTIEHPPPYHMDIKQLHDPFASMTYAKATSSGERSVLETYEINTLKMAGTIVQGTNRWGLILSQDGKLYRVRVGDALGTRGGIVSAIEDRQIELNDGQSGANSTPQEHKSVLMLTGKSDKQP
jgi:type IV pilus assembly protein PilP